MTKPTDQAALAEHMALVDKLIVTCMEGYRGGFEDTHNARAAVEASAAALQAPPVPGEPVSFGVRGKKLCFTVGVQTFTLDYEPDEAEGSEYMQKMLLKAIAAAKVEQQPAIEYTPGEWFDATTVDLMEAFYRSRLPAIREAAQGHGYAIGVHGSMRRDLDLIAAPWRDGASDADTLAEAIQRAACGFGMASRQWEQKPGGRVATCLPICWTHRHGVASDGHIDLSVVAQPAAKPAQPTVDAGQGERDKFTTCDADGFVTDCAPHPKGGYEITAASDRRVEPRTRVLFVKRGEV